MSDAPVSRSAVNADFTVSAAPHVASGASTSKIMFEVAAAMLPIFGAAIVFYREYAFLVMLPTLLGCFLAEAFANWLRGRAAWTSLSDGTALVTGMILALSLPPSLNPYMCFIGGAVAILLGKMVFGGVGQNLFNPAMVGRAFLMVCFPAALGVWKSPYTAHDVDAVTMPTPLQAVFDPQASIASYTDLFLGNVSGSLGETSVLAALVGGLWIVLRGVADWRQPVGVFAGVLLIGLPAWWGGALGAASPLYHLFSGSLVFGAFFIATDYVGSPINPLGRLVFGVGVGVLTMVIRVWGAYPEGVMFAILIMNSLTPLIERITTPTPFGGHVPKE